MEIALFVEIKNEFMEQLSNILTPYIWEGMNSIYKSAANDAMKSENEEKTLLIFQKYLQKVATWNQLQIDDETNRIKTTSNTSDYLDDLVKAVIKSNVTLLTYSSTNTTAISQTFYDSIKTSSFIHLCYIECAKEAHNNPYLFYHDVAPMDSKRNQLVIHQNIEQSICKAIKKMLPLKIILKEYMLNPSIALQPKTYGGVELIGDNLQPVEIKPLSVKKSNSPKIYNKDNNQKQILSIPREKKFNQPNIYANNLLNKIKSDRIVKSDHVIMSPEKKKLNKKLINAMSDMNIKSVESFNNGKLNKSDRNILNIDDVATNVNTESSISNTTLTNNLFQNKNYTENDTDIINPHTIDLIEDYGK